MSDFEHFLVTGKGVSAATRECYGRHVGAFLTTMADPAGEVDLAGVSAQWVRSYVTNLGGRYAPESLKLIATAVRSFLRFAWMSGWTRCDLTAAVGAVVTHRSGHLPKALPGEDLERLLAIPDRATTTGRRDYALLLVMSRLGLRAGEVARLRLDDLDWRAATVTPRVKGGRRLCLPIPHDVGQAVVAYLGQRPAGVACREVFLQVRGGLAPMTGRAVTQVVARHAARAGLGDGEGPPATALSSPGRKVRWRQPDRGWRTARSRQWRGDHGLCLFELRSLAVLARPWPVEADDA